jgi:hypothetical protein
MRYRRPELFVPARKQSANDTATASPAGHIMRNAENRRAVSANK